MVYDIETLAFEGNQNQHGYWTTDRPRFYNGDVCLDHPLVSQAFLEIVRFRREMKAAVFETLNYFDCVNFARQAKAPALFSVALMDEVCAPSTVYGAYNAYAGEKTITEYEFNNHEGGQGYQERVQMAWLSRLFGVS